MARVRGITQFYPPPTHLSTNGMNHDMVGAHQNVNGLWASTGYRQPTCLYSASIRQMALPERGSAHLITAHYSFIDLERMKG